MLQTVIDAEAGVDARPIPARGGRRSRTVAATLLWMAALCLSTSAAAESRHGISTFGDLKYPADFEHFDYANPDAPKGGKVTLGTLGSFDNLNPFILKGQAAAGAGLVYDTLMAQSLDEPASMYGLLAESADVADDKSSVTFTLRESARWHDGEPVRADDVVWTFDTLMSEGHPQYQQYYSAVEGVEAIDELTVRFTFSESDNAELPMIVSQLAVLPEHYWADREFADTTLEPPLGSGPYRVARVDPGRSIRFERVDDYWGADLPVNAGKDNFGTLTYDYYRDMTVWHEAFKAGDVDFKIEYIAKNWATGYDFPAINDGRVVKEDIEDKSLQPMQQFAFNTRLDKFSDPRVREALGLAFDFEWFNQNLFYDAYERTRSYFQNGDMMATGLPSEAELALLEPFRDQLPDDVFTEAYEPPATDGSGNLRTQYRAALALLREAGWEIRNGRLTNVETGEVMNIEMILRQPSVERVALPYARALERLGVNLRVRVVDSAQYEKRMEDFDYEMTTHIFLQTRSPGNEQWNYWGSGAAERPGSGNVLGIQSEAVDALIREIVRADSRDAQVTAATALDRVLLHGHYAIPMYFGPTYRVAYWDKFGHPGEPPENDLGFSFWWVEPEKAAALDG